MGQAAVLAGIIISEADIHHHPVVIGEANGFPDQAKQAVEGFFMLRDPAAEQQHLGKIIEIDMQANLEQRRLGQRLVQLLLADLLIVGFLQHLAQQLDKIIFGTGMIKCAGVRIRITGRIAVFQRLQGFMELEMKDTAEHLVKLAKLVFLPGQPGILDAHLGDIALAERDKTVGSGQWVIHRTAITGKIGGTIITPSKLIGGCHRSLSLITRHEPVRPGNPE